MEDRRREDQQNVPFRQCMNHSPELLEGVCAGDIRVQDEEGRVILAQNLPGESQRSSCSQWFGFNAEGDVDAILLLGLLQDSDHDFWAVVDSENDIGDSCLSGALIPPQRGFTAKRAP